MKKFKMQILCSCYFILLPLVCSASSINSITPEAVNRTFIQNYKDMGFRKLFSASLRGHCFNGCG